MTTQNFQITDTQNQSLEQIGQKTRWFEIAIPNPSDRIAHTQTTVGIAHMLGMDVERSLNEVAASNDSKFGEDGQPIFNKQRKIIKGPRYRSPNLAAYTVKRTAKDE